MQTRVWHYQRFLPHVSRILIQVHPRALLAHYLNFLLWHRPREPGNSPVPVFSGPTSLRRGYRGSKLNFSFHFGSSFFLFSFCVQRRVFWIQQKDFCFLAVKLVRWAGGLNYVSRTWRTRFNERRRGRMWHFYKSISCATRQKWQNNFDCDQWRMNTISIWKNKARSLYAAPGKTTLKKRMCPTANLRRKVPTNYARI